MKMDLTTNYLGLTLRSPLVPSAGPLSKDLDNFKRLEDAGAAAVVMHSLFEEQIRYERYEYHRYMTQGTESYPEALTFFPELCQCSQASRRSGGERAGFVQPLLPA